MERATSPCLRSKTFSSARRASSSMMMPYRGTTELPCNNSKRRLEFDESQDAPYASQSPSARIPPVRDTSVARGFSSTIVSSIYQNHSTWNQRHLDTQVLGFSNLSDHAKHARLLDLSSHSQQPGSFGGGSTLRPPGRRVDSGDDERLEAPARIRGRNDENASFASGRGGSGGSGGGGSDEKSQVTITSVRSRSVVSRQHSLLSLDNLSFCTELHAVMQRQASQSSLCSFASHAIHKRRNSWSSTCGDSITGAANIPPYLLRLTSASSALSGTAGGGGLQVTEQLDRDDSSASSWLQHVTSIRLDTSTVSHLRHDRYSQPLHQHHGQKRPSNPITADARWLRQLSSRSLSSFTTITTTTTTHATSNNTSPPLPSALALRTPVQKGATRTPYPSPEDCVPQTSTGHGANMTPKPPTRKMSASDLETSAQGPAQTSLRYSPEQPPYYRGAVIRRVGSTQAVTHRYVVAGGEASTTADGTLAFLSQPRATLSSGPTPSLQYQPPLPLRQTVQTLPTVEPPFHAPSFAEERMASSWTSEEMEVEDAYQIP